MIIDKKMIAEQKIVGKTTQDNPVLYIMTYGGLFGFFTKNKKGEVETLATAPHKAIAAWMAEKKAGGIQWETGFSKTESSLSDLKKSEESRFNRMRSLLFDGRITDIEKSEYYIVYDLKKSIIGMLSHDEIADRMTSSNIDTDYVVVRNTSLNERPTILSDHKEFKGVKKS